jgi:acyl carrier protein
MTATAESIGSAVREVVSTLADCPSADDALLDVDSLTLVELAEALEDRFGFRVKATDVSPDNFSTIGKLVEYVSGRVNS